MTDERYFNYAALAQMVTDPIANKVIAVNQEACRILAMDIEQLQSSQVSELFKHSLPELIVFTDEVLHRGRAWCDGMLLGHDGVRVEVTGKSVEAGDERYLYLSIQCVEEIDRLRESSDAHQHYISGIGHWNRVARVFQEFERENQLLLEAAGEGIYGVDASGNTTFVNPAAQRILGYTADELAGRNMHTMVHHSHPNGAHYNSEGCPIFAAFKEGVVQSVEGDVFWTKLGKAVDVEYTSTPIVESGAIMGAVVVFRDITQKKSDKKQLLEALEEVEQLKNRLELENAYLQEEINSEFNHHQIIGNSAAVQNILQQIKMVAPTEATTLIYGESGTGKELIARAIHEESNRSKRSLIRVNCAAIPEDLFESEFFGHVKGAFTGATQDRAGRFQLADGGTLFLDEVGEIPLHLQSKLLRVLQEKQFERIGEAKTHSVDVRIIAATNRDLKALVDQGRFREDLYFRLNVFPIHSASLRQRVKDIPLLTQHFLEKSCARSGKPLLKISLGELKKLQSYDWPGNIRELENVIERQVILSRGDTVRFDGLAISPGSVTMVDPIDGAKQGVLTKAEMQQRERRNILIAMEQSHGKVFGQNGAAELLGMKPTTLSSKLAKFKIVASQFKHQAV
jgi:PAS domain S-box-containing protein